MTVVDSQHGTVLDAHVTITLGEFCQLCGVHAELVIEMVDEGVIESPGRGPSEWRFHGEALVRAERALRLNWPGAALALDQLDELEQRDKLLRRAPQPR